MITPGPRLLVAGDFGCGLRVDMRFISLVVAALGNQMPSAVIMAGRDVILIDFEVPRRRVHLIAIDDGD